MRTQYQISRIITLSHIQMLRTMIREGRQVISAQNCIRDAQRHLLHLRHARAMQGETS